MLVTLPVFLIISYFLYQFLHLMKITTSLFTTIFCILMGSLAFGQGTTVELLFQLENCASVDSITIYEMKGVHLQKVYGVKQDAQQRFSIQLPRTATPKVYFYGMNFDNTRVKALILGTEGKVVVSGPCFNPALVTVNSPVNQAYQNALTQVNNYKMEMGTIIGEYREQYNDPVKRAEIEKKMGAVDKKKKDLLESVKKTQPFVAKIIALDTYLSYQNSPDAKKYKDELDYFATEYFHFAELSDPAYNDIPMVYDLSKSYTEIVTQLGFNEDLLKSHFDKLLSRFANPSRGHQYALGAIAGILVNNSHALGGTYGKMYSDLYNREDPVGSAEFSNKLRMMEGSRIGKPAPEIVQNNPDSIPLRLSDLKGKVVLIDFWASWCGPCRRENPNVVNLYKQYKDKGFEVFSVSLDRSRDAWMKAINDDGLIWKSHVSDLKHWGNEAAQLYGVTSIPRTILLDREGKVIAENLRGEELGLKLQQILGQ